MNKGQKFALALMVGILAVFAAVPIGAAVGQGLNALSGSRSFSQEGNVIFAYSANGTAEPFGGINNTAVIDSGSGYFVLNATQGEMASNSMNELSLFVSGSTGTVSNNTSRQSTLYNVTFSDPPLPKGTSWAVNLSTGKGLVTSNSSITFRVPNGTYSYFVSPLSFLYSADNSTGSFTVQGSPVTISVNFYVSQKLLVTVGSGNSSKLQVINPVNLSLLNISLPGMWDSLDSTAFTPMSIVTSINGSYAYVLCADATHSSSYMNITVVNLRDGSVVHTIRVNTSDSTPENSNNMTLNPWSKVPQLILSIGNNNLTFVNLNNYTVKELTLPGHGYSGSMAISPVEPYGYILSSGPAGGSPTGTLNLTQIDLANDTMAENVSTHLPYPLGTNFPNGAMAISPFGNMIAVGASGVGTVYFYNASLAYMGNVSSPLLDFNGAPPMMFSRNMTELFYGNTTIMMPSASHPGYRVWRYSDTPVTGMIESFDLPFSPSMFNDTYLYYPDAGVLPTYYVKALNLLNNSTSVIETLHVLPYALSLVYTGSLTGMHGFGSWNFNVSSFVSRNFVASNATEAVPLTMEIGFGSSASDFYPLGSVDLISSGWVNFTFTPSDLTGNQSYHLMAEYNSSYLQLDLSYISLTGSKFSGYVSGEDAGYVIGGIMILALSAVELPLGSGMKKGGRKK